MTKTVTRRMRAFVAVLSLTLAGPLAASRLAFQQTGQITAIATEKHAIKINGVSYRLAKKVAVHATERSAKDLDVYSLQSGAKIGYSLSGTRKKDQAPEINTIWVLPGNAH